MSTIKTWWTFTRPHTIIGSLVSIISLYIINGVEAAEGILPKAHVLLTSHTAILALTLVSALATNIYITGLNQLTDVEVDKVNKPWLPLAANTITVGQARLVVFAALGIALVTAAFLSWFLLLLIAIIIAIGTAYSLPPLRFKRHHLPAAMAIVVVRGLLVNLGMSAHFTQKFTGVLHIPPGVWPLTLFIAAFSIGIAWFKDIPDTTGDEQFQFKTLAVARSPKTALWLGVTVVSAAYVALATAPLFWPLLVNARFFSLIHIALCMLFIMRSSQLKLGDADSIKQFYRFYWALFFTEYIIYPLSYLLDTQ